MKFKIEFEFPNKLLDDIKRNVSKNPSEADDIINDSLSQFTGGEYPGGDPLGDALIAEVKKVLNIKANFSERITAVFNFSSIRSSNPGKMGLSYLKDLASKYNGKYDNNKKMVSFKNPEDYVEAIKELKDKCDDLIFTFVSNEYDDAVNIHPSEYNIP